MSKPEFVYGEEVIIPWGVEEVRGTVHEVYGKPPRVRVVVRLTPELTGEVVDEPTTVTLRSDVVRKVVPAA